MCELSRSTPEKRLFDPDELAINASALVTDPPANPAHENRLRVVRHARTIAFQLAEVAFSGTVFYRIHVAINRLRAPPVPA